MMTKPQCQHQDYEDVEPGLAPEALDNRSKKDQVPVYWSEELPKARDPTD